MVNRILPWLLVLALLIPIGMRRASTALDHHAGHHAAGSPSSCAAATQKCCCCTIDEPSTPGEASCCTPAVAAAPPTTNPCLHDSSGMCRCCAKAPAKPVRPEEPEPRVRIGGVCSSGHEVVRIALLGRAQRQPGADDALSLIAAVNSRDSSFHLPLGGSRRLGGWGVDLNARLCVWTT